MKLKGNKSENEIREEAFNELMEDVDLFASYYRSNPNRFAKDYLNLTLDTDQEIALCELFKTSNSILLASRGWAKTFMLGVFSCSYSILYPGTKICVASKTRKQATEVLHKIIDVLMPLSCNLRAEILDMQINQAEAFIKFKNGSKINVVTASDNARGNRATILICDEVRMIDKGIIDNILKNFLTDYRRPGYLEKEEYQNYPKEDNKVVYATSCWYEEHWSYELVRSYLVNMMKGKSFFVCSMPYQVAIKEGRLQRQRIEENMAEANFDSCNFLMEMEALFFGKGNGGFFSFDEIEKNRKILYPYFPKSAISKPLDKRFICPQKKPGEIRIMSADIALMSSNKNKNDATAIFINFMTPIGENRYSYNIVYTENNEGLRTDAQALRLRKLFDEFECDYLAIDAKSVGLSIIDLLMADIYDKESGITYPAITCCNNKEIAERCSVKGAPEKIWAIMGSSEFNSKCAIGLRESLRQGKVRLLTSEYDAEENLTSIKGWGNLTPQEEIEYKLPYINTTLLEHELINLEHEIKNNVVKVKEKAGERKDRYSSLSYNIFVAKEIEREQQVRDNQIFERSFDIRFKTPSFIKNKERRTP